ncbi:MAG: coproporphyrinogen III oxidase, partial [Verrucomicrobiota bacterium]
MLDTPAVASLYVHVPFCARKCDYCAFYSEAGDGALVNRYVRALITEMEMVAAESQPQTVFFG